MISNNAIANKELNSSLSQDAKVMLWMKRGVWLYFILLIFEGALRKWVLPGLSEVLLIIRDPLVLAMIVYGWFYGVLPKVSYIWWMLIIATVAVFTSLFAGHGNLFVSLYGARILIIHFPMIFIIGKIFDREDVLKLGKAVLFLSIPMALLIALQFYSPQSAWVNRSVGGGFGTGFAGSLGYFRPPGTFSFTNGTTLFFSLVGAFVLYFWMNPKGVNKLILLGSTGSLLISIPLSISRGLTFTVGIMLIFTLIAVSRKPKYLGQFLVGGFGVLLTLTILSSVGIFQTGLDVLTERFDSAARVEGGVEGTIGNRYIGNMINAITEATKLPFFGLGIGMGTNAGSALLSGTRGFLISEGEWGRLVGEMGALLGVSVILMRVIISFRLSVESFLRLKTGDMLPWMLLSFALLVFPQGQWAQPTTLGFSTLIVGILIASFNEGPDKDHDFDKNRFPGSSLDSP